jgi:hypothetical protein
LRCFDNMSSMLRKYSDKKAARCSRCPLTPTKVARETRLQTHYTNRLIAYA